MDLLARISRLAFAALILWLLWGYRVFWPAHRDLPEDTVMLASNEAFQPLATGRNIAIEGKVYPANETAGEAPWKDRFAYRRTISRKSEFGGQEEVVTHHVRPAIRFEWAGGTLAVPADSYRMESAPKAPGDSLLLTTEQNVGFRPGDAALALCRKIGDKTLVVDELAIGPLDAYLKTLKRGNDIRAWFGHGLRVVVSFFTLSLIVAAFRRTPATDGEPKL